MSFRLTHSRMRADGLVNRSPDSLELEGQATAGPIQVPNKSYSLTPSESRFVFTTARFSIRGWRYFFGMETR
jgi:hypothetical protein